MKNQNTCYISIILTIIIIVYISSYFLLVDSKVTLGSLRDGATWTDLPCYKGGIPEELFYPMHYLDKTYLRPKKWKYVVHEIKSLDINDNEL